MTRGIVAPHTSPWHGARTCCTRLDLAAGVVLGDGRCGQVTAVLRVALRLVEVDQVRPILVDMRLLAVALAEEGHPVDALRLRSAKRMNGDGNGDGDGKGKGWEWGR